MQITMKKLINLLICFFKDIWFTRILFAIYPSDYPISGGCYHISFKSMNDHFNIRLVCFNDYRLFFEFKSFIHNQNTSQRKEYQMKRYHIFISHAWRYSSHYYKVVDWLNEAQKDGLLTWSNYSVPEHDPLVDPNSTTGKKKLQGAIDNQIAPASIVLVLSGMYAAYSDWIEYEVLKSIDYGKYIIGIRPWGQERTPRIVSDYADVMVGWNKSSIINAVLNI